MPENEVKNQHYVPQAYLRKFANAKEQIWVYDKKEANSFQTHVRNVASEHRFYDSEALERIKGNKQFVEKHLRDIEGRYDSTIKSILNSLSTGRFKRIGARDRHFLSAYMVVQMLRTKESRITRTHLAKTLLGIHHRLHAEYGLEPPDEHELLQGKSPEELAKDIQNEQILNVNLIEEFAGILFRHIWLIQKSFNDDLFITSDHPFAKRPHITGTWRSMNGIASEGIEIVFPLSPKFLLTLVDRRYFNSVEEMDGCQIPLLCHDNMIYNNQFQIYESNRFIFSRSGDFSFVEDVLKENPIHANPDRERVGTDRGGIPWNPESGTKT